MKTNLVLALCLLMSLSQAMAQKTTADATSGAPTGTFISAQQSRLNNNRGSMIAQVMGIGFGVAAASYASQAASCWSGCSGTGATCSACPGLAKNAVIYAGFSASSLIQSSANGATAGNAGATGIATDGYGFGNSNYNASAGNDGALAKLLGGDKLQTGKNALNQLSTTGIGGISVDPKTGTVTDKDGKKYKASDFSSAGSMQAAGFSPDEIKQAMEQARKLEADATKKVESLTGKQLATYDESSGGGGAAPPISTSENEDSQAQNGSKSLSERLPAGATGVAGLTKNYNGENIGISEDNIFNMMSRRYKLKEKQDTFFSNAELIQK